MHNDYFEGILQLRNPSDEVISFILNELDKRKNVFITKQKKLKNGLDLYFTDQHFLQGLGKKLSQKFCGELKISKKIFTRNRQTSREVYRVNVLFRYYPYKLGQVFTIRGEKVKLLRLGRKVTVKNVQTGKKSFIRFGDLE